MPSRPDARRIRRLAMQMLYQIDLTRDIAPDAERLEASLDDSFDPAAVREEGVALAVAAWASRSEADRLVAELSPEWPTHRQPPVDRAILRLALHEIRTGRVPVKVAINEAIELAKDYAGEHSPAFINGVLDKIARNVTPSSPPEQPTGDDGDRAEPFADRPGTPDSWLRDAMTGKG